MECVLQWLDNLDDFVTALPLRIERLRYIVLRLLGFVTTLAVLAGVVVTAIEIPVVAPLLAAALLLSLAWQREPAARRPALPRA